MHTLAAPVGAHVTELDRQQIDKLVAALKLANPAVTSMVEVNEEGEPYVHIGSPDDTLSYLIEPFKAGWRGLSQGTLVLPKKVAKTAGAVATAAAMAWVADLSELVSAASALLNGG